MGELTFENHLINTFCEMLSVPPSASPQKHESIAFGTPEFTSQILYYQ